MAPKAMERWDKAIPNASWAVAAYYEAGNPPLTSNGKLILSNLGFVRSSWTIRPDASGKIDIEADWCFDHTTLHGIESIRFILTSSTPGNPAWYAGLLIFRDGAYLAQLQGSHSTQWIQGGVDSSHVPGAASPLGGKSRIILQDDTWYLKHDIGNGYSTVLSTPNGGYSDNIVGQIFFVAENTKPYDSTTFDFTTSTSSDALTIYSGDLDGPAPDPPPDPPPPTLPAINDVVVTAQIAGGKKATANIFINQPCKCPYTLTVDADKSTLYI